MRILPRSTRVQIVKCLTEGMSVRSTTRLCGVSKDAVLKLIGDMGAVCAAHHDDHVRGLTVHNLQADELWSFVGAKAGTIKKRPDLQEIADIGDAWVWVGIDRDTKLVVSYLVGTKSAESAADFMGDLAGRVVNRMQLSTDGFKPYFKAVPDAFGDEVDFGRIIKQFGNPQPDGRIGTTKLECVGVIREAVIGNPVEEDICTSHIERQNLTVRMSARRFTRLTNAFSKKWENHCAATSMHFFFYNFCRRHTSLKGSTPAMRAGLSDHAWSVDEMVILLEKEEQARIDAGSMKRGPYRKNRPLDSI